LREPLFRVDFFLVVDFFLDVDDFFCDVDFFRPELFRELDDFRELAFRLEDDVFDGTFPPARRASESPIAIACFRLFTFFPERPLLSVPFFRSCIAFSTFCDAFLPYLAIGSPRRIPAARGDR